MPEQTTPTTPVRDSLSQFVGSLHRDYEIWYAKSVRRIYRCNWILQLTVLLAGFLSSVIAAVVNKEQFVWGKWVLVVLPAIGSLAATCLLQFHTYELWRLRESGRIAFQDLAITGQRLLAAATNEEECARIHQQLALKLTEIEKVQSDSYFGLFRADFVFRPPGGT